MLEVIKRVIIEQKGEINSMDKLSWFNIIR